MEVRSEKNNPFYKILPYLWLSFPLPDSSLAKREWDLSRCIKKKETSYTFSPTFIKWVVI